MKCAICGDDGETRFGVCFKCAESESVIEDGTNMWDETVASTSMGKLRYILEKYGIAKSSIK